MFVNSEIKKKENSEQSPKSTIQNNENGGIEKLKELKAMQKAAEEQK